MGSRNRFDKTLRVEPVKLRAPIQVRSRAENRRGVGNPANPTGGTMGAVIPSMMNKGEVYGDLGGSGFSDLRGSTQPGSVTPAATNAGEGRAFVKAEEHRKSAGYPEGVTWPMDYEKNPGTVNNTRNVEKIGPNGLRAKGTQTSPVSTPIEMNRNFDEMLGSLGLTAYQPGQPFSSNQLPTTASSPVSGQNPHVPEFMANAPGITGQSYDNYGANGGAAAASSTDRSKFTPMTGEEARIDGASQTIAPNASSISSGRLADALGDTANMNIETPGRREAMARAAFLDADTSMGGLRAKEAVNGVVYASGQHHIRSGEGSQSIDQDQAWQIASGKAKAQKFLTDKKDSLVASAAQKPAEVESPNTKEAFSRNETISATMPTDIAGSVDFSANNDNEIKGFGNTGGYKSGFKRIDTSMPNAFGG